MTKTIVRSLCTMPAMTALVATLLAALPAERLLAQVRPQSGGTAHAGGAVRVSSGGISESTSRTQISEGDLRVEIATKSRQSQDAEGNVTIDEQKEISASIGGIPVPKDRIRELDDRIEILGEQGEILRSVATPKVLARGAAGDFAVARAARDNARRAGGAVVGRPQVRLGVSLETADPALARQLRVPADEVSVISAVVPDGPAAKAGIQPYDVVIAVDGQKPASPDHLRKALVGKKPGETLRLTLAEGALTRDVEVQLEANKDEGGGLSWVFEGTPLGDLDMTFTEEIKSALEALRSRDFGFSAEDLRMLLAPMMAPRAPSAPGAPTPPTGLYRFSVPAPTPPAALGESAAGAERIRRLEATIERLEETIRRLEERLPPAPPSAPRPIA